MQKKQPFILFLALFTLIFSLGSAILSFSEALHAQGLNSYLLPSNAEQHHNGECFTADIVLIANCALPTSDNKLIIVAFTVFLTSFFLIKHTIKITHVIHTIRAPPRNTFHQKLC